MLMHGILSTNQTPQRQYRFDGLPTRSRSSPRLQQSLTFVCLSRAFHRKTLLFFCYLENYQDVPPAHQRHQTSRHTLVQSSTLHTASLLFQNCAVEPFAWNDVSPRSWHGALSVSRNKFLFHINIYYLLAKVQTIIENTPLSDIFLPQNIKIYSLLGQNGAK